MDVNVSNDDCHYCIHKLKEQTLINHKNVSLILLRLYKSLRITNVLEVIDPLVMLLMNVKIEILAASQST